MAEIRRIFRLTKPYAAVQVEISKKGKPIRYIISSGPTDSSICCVKPDTLLFSLFEDETVITKDGEVLAACGKFYRTVETIDPYHLILDIWDADVLDATNNYVKG